MLNEPSAPNGISEMDIEMDTPGMDVSDNPLAPEDEVLKSLFAADEEPEQQEPEQQQGQKQGSVRTASVASRTLGTRPTQGVSRVGGGAAPERGGEIGQLSSMWSSAPDVRKAFE